MDSYRPSQTSGTRGLLVVTDVSGRTSRSDTQGEGAWRSWCVHNGKASLKGIILYYDQ